MSAGCPYELAITDGLAAIGSDRERRRIERHNAFAKAHCHSARVPKFGGTKQYPLEWLVACEIFLRHGWTLIGQFGLFPDDRDAA
jgi:hypothetical protein